MSQQSVRPPGNRQTILGLRGPNKLGAKPPTLREEGVAQTNLRSFSVLGLPERGSRNGPPVPGRVSLVEAQPKLTHLKAS
jgi:hypothetical protein